MFSITRVIQIARACAFSLLFIHNCVIVLQARSTCLSQCVCVCGWVGVCVWWWCWGGSYSHNSIPLRSGMQRSYKALTDAFLEELNLHYLKAICHCLWMSQKPAECFAILLRDSSIFSRLNSRGCDTFHNIHDVVISYLFCTSTQDSGLTNNSCNSRG